MEKNQGIKRTIISSNLKDFYLSWYMEKIKVLRKVIQQMYLTIDEYQSYAIFAKR